MREKLTITFSDLNGAKTYTIHKIFKKILFWFIIFILSVMLFSFLTIYFLNKKTANYLNIKFQNHKMKLIITQKNRELNNINKKLSEIEIIAGIKPSKNIKNSQKEYIKRINVAKSKLILRNDILRKVPNGYIVTPFLGFSSTFGMRIHPISHKKIPHYGVDFRAHLKTAVRAPADGVVERVAYEKYGYGKLIILDHGLGFKTRYGHLSKYKVKVGDYVTKGQIIALSGNTGLSTGPHVHYEVRYLGKILNPKNFIKLNRKNYKNIFKKEKKIKWKFLIKMLKMQEQKIEEQLL